MAGIHPKGWMFFQSGTRSSRPRWVSKSQQRDLEQYILKLMSFVNVRSSSWGHQNHEDRPRGLKETQCFLLYTVFSFRDENSRKVVFNKWEQNNVNFIDEKDWSNRVSSSTRVSIDAADSTNKGVHGTEFSVKTVRWWGRIVILLRSLYHGHCTASTHLMILSPQGGRSIF